MVLLHATAVSSGKHSTAHLSEPLSSSWKSHIDTSGFRSRLHFFETQLCDFKGVLFPVAGVEQLQ